MKSASAVAHIIVRRHFLQLSFDLVVHFQGVHKIVDSPSSQSTPAVSQNVCVWTVKLKGFWGVLMEKHIEDKQLNRTNW